MCVYVQGN